MRLDSLVLSHGRTDTRRFVMTRQKGMCRPDEWELKLRRQCDELIRRSMRGSATFGWEETSERLQRLIAPPRRPTAEELSKLASLRLAQMDRFFSEILKLDIEIPDPSASGRQIRRYQREGWELFCRPIDHLSFMKALWARFESIKPGYEMEEPFCHRIKWADFTKPYWFWYRTFDPHGDAGPKQLREIGGKERDPHLEEYKIAYHYQALKGKEMHLASTNLLTFIAIEGGFNRMEATGHRICQHPQSIDSERITQLTS